MLHAPIAGGQVMPGVPIFIEVDDTRKIADARICSQVVELLMAKQIQPVGLAGSAEETRAILEQMKEHNLEPALFAINTFGAKEVLPALDPLMGDAPAIFFRRSLYVGRSGFLDTTAVGATLALEALIKIKPRLASIWYYGSKNCGELAKRAAVAIALFLESGDFLHIERAGTESKNQ